MKTSIDCLPCFLKQVLHTARLCSSDPVIQSDIVTGVLPILSELNFQLSPPENAVAVYDFITELGGCADPFATLKKESTSLARHLEPELTQIIETASNPFEIAVKLILAGNIIDYGSQQSFDVQQTIDDSLNQNPVGDTIEQFRNDIVKTKTILYLGDNCGEIFFDKLFIQMLSAEGKKIIFAVKEKPIINDALVEDALEANIDNHCTIISNGTGTPGTPLSQCSNELRSAFQSADLIISKGQGNFETLSDATGPIYYLLTVKCEVVANHISLLLNSLSPPFLGEMVLLKNRKWERAETV